MSNRAAAERIVAGRGIVLAIVAALDAKDQEIERLTAEVQRFSARNLLNVAAKWRLLAEAAEAEVERRGIEWEKATIDLAAAIAERGQQAIRADAAESREARLREALEGIRERADVDSLTPLLRLVECARIAREALDKKEDGNG